ncbi:DUF2480 family protein [Dyadobacter fanqingshengii]|uniref:DUF2480 family protein n=1 Tax=Dyadobacter fanqingshengii TaxID=2906443 RepID=A0A9X1PGK6_9BACT|nr:DUF2480 family protein [Dyadobacter fanqingshengii]MCF0043513.1 DUF2480 family protein [Dyadobacter fanqingshengii]USJ34868.1 DUF2480 family protein [Dyadobacter fanqingshengii]
METEEIVNRVAVSGIVSLDLEELYHSGERVLYDIKDNLWQGMILKEKDFREFLKAHDWTQYQGKNVAIICSEDAIVPTWAYMLLAVQLEPYANAVVFGDLNALEDKLFADAISKLNISEFEGKRVVVKGCSKVPVPISAYVEVSRLLKPIVQSLMFGEPCSTVPLYKKPKSSNSSSIP